MATLQQPRPAWYSNEDDSAWERIKEAFRRDWRQTKHDFGGKEPDLNQQVGDTVSQATGSKPIPAANAKTPHPAPASEAYSEADEPAYRFGYAAYRHYGKRSDWGDATEAQLESDWGDKADWQRRRAAVQRGWLYGKSRSSDIANLET